MIKNVTLAIDEDLIKKARKIAEDRNTTVTGLIRTYLQQLVEREERCKEESISELRDIFDRSQAVIGEKKWVREDLYER